MSKNQNYIYKHIFPFPSCVGKWLQNIISFLNLNTYTFPGDCGRPVSVNLYILDVAVKMHLRTSN